MSSRKAKKLIKEAPKSLRLYKIELKDIKQGRIYLIVWRLKNNKRHQASKYNKHTELIYVLNKNQVLELGNHYVTSLTNMKELRDRLDPKQRDREWVNAIYRLR